MKLLLDTHTFIWWDSDPSKLSAPAMTAINDPNNALLVSVVTPWEMVIKQQLGKITLSLPVADIVAQQQSNGIEILNIELDHVLEVESLPLAHKDPFDRLLLAQSKVEGATIVTVDPVFSQYPVKVLW